MVSRAILSTMLWFPKAEMKNLPDKRRALTLSSRFNRGDQEPVQCYRETKNWFGYPRYYFGDLTDLVDQGIAESLVDKTSRGSAISLPVTSKPRDEGQEHLLGLISASLEKGRTGLLVKAPTAAGKTFLGIKTLEMIGRTALVLVYKSDLIDHWVAELELHTRMNPKKIGLGTGGTIDWEGKSIVIALVQTVSKLREDAEFYKRFGVVLLDEPHRTGPPHTFAPALSAFNSRYRICVGATLKRKDGLHRILNWDFGEKRIQAKRKYADKFKTMPAAVIVLKLRWGYDKIPRNLDVIVRKAILLKMIEKHPLRNLLLARYVMKFLKNPRRNVIILSERTRQLFLIRQILIYKMGLPEEDTGIYCDTFFVREEKVKVNGRYRKKAVSRKVKQAEKDHARTARVIFGTTKMLDTGTNMPEVSGLMIASPLSDIEQPLGRPGRWKPDKDNTVIVDAIDVAFQDAVKWGQDRMATYARLGIKVTEKRHTL